MRAGRTGGTKVANVSSPLASARGRPRQSFLAGGVVVAGENRPAIQLTRNRVIVVSSHFTCVEWVRPRGQALVPGVVSRSPLVPRGRVVTDNLPAISGRF